MITQCQEEVKEGSPGDWDWRVSLEGTSGPMRERPGACKVDHFFKAFKCQRFGAEVRRLGTS